jgi:hypothetical protein
MKPISSILLIIILASCNSSKQALTYENIESGQDLDKVTLISFEDFFNRWLQNREVQKVDVNIREINKDDQFTYFGKPSFGLSELNWTFFKVYSDTLTERFPNYKDFYSENLRLYIWNNVAPKEDLELYRKNRVVQDGKMAANCPSRKNGPINDFTLKDQNVFLTITWEVDWEEMERLKNTKYSASYNLLTKEFMRESIE